VKVQGWVQTLRDQKRMQFLVLRDRTGAVQAALEKAQNPALASALSALTRESAVSAVGRVVENPQVKAGGIEIHLTALRVEGLASSPLPLDPFGPSGPTLDHRLDWRFLDLRRPENLLIFQVQTTAEMAMRRVWLSEGFLEIHSPKLMGSPSESGAELFELDYFGRKAYLAQSPQFYKQMAMAAGLDRVFEIAPAFRADPSFTARHTTEFTSVDVEMAWIESHEDLMAFEERWLQSVLNAVRERHGEEIRERLGVEVRVPELPFPRISMQDATALLGRKGYAPPPDRQGDLDPQGERLLSQHVAETLGHEFVFVTDYPASVRPFYHMRGEADPATTKSFDLLYKGLEITTGAQREHRYDALVRQALEKGLSLEPLRFYLDFFRFGCPPHGGFGFGLARLLMALLRRSNLRETTFLPRSPNRLHP
jgi:aspartyl-tRNA synthetase